MPNMKSAQLEEMIHFYKERRIAIRKRLKEFSKVQSADYFYELVYCLLTPQSSAVHAEQVVITTSLYWIPISQCKSRTISSSKRMLYPFS